jgi:hypothetical protein
MIVHINQPRFLPALNYFQRMLIADIWIWRDDVQFQRKDWENRNKIKTARGWQWVTVPVKACPLGTNIMLAEIDVAMNWPKKMLGSIQCAYGRAPYFDEFYPQIAHVLGQWHYLTKLNGHMICMFREAWGLNRCKFYLASELGCQGTKDGILIEMCKKVGADVYLSGAEGRNYNRPEEWAKAGIELRHHDYDPVPYPQQFGGFLPWMSALDLLMNCGAGGRKYLETGIERYA